MNNNAKQLRAQSRRMRVAELILRGVTNQVEICRELGLPPSEQPTISRDIKALREDWRCRTTLALDEVKGEELARLDAVIAAAWLGWEKSLQDAETREASKSDGRETARRTSRGQSGNPSFLRAIIEAIARKCAVLGLDVPPEPTKGAAKGTPRLSVEDVLQADRDVEEYRRARFGDAGNGVAGAPPWTN